MADRPPIKSIPARDIWEVFLLHHLNVSSGVFVTLLTFGQSITQAMGITAGIVAIAASPFVELPFLYGLPDFRIPSARGGSGSSFEWKALVSCVLSICVGVCIGLLFKEWLDRTDVVLNSGRRVLGLELQPSIKKVFVKQLLKMWGINFVGGVLFAYLCLKRRNKTDTDLTDLD